MFGKFGGAVMLTRSSSMLARVIVAALGLMMMGAPVFAATHDIVVERHVVNVTGRDRVGMLINGQLPGPVLQLYEGEDAVINVTNRLDENISIHWHGLIVPPEMDGVPGISPGYGDGIKPGETFTYRFGGRRIGPHLPDDRTIFAVQWARDPSRNLNKLDVPASCLLPVPMPLAGLIVNPIVAQTQTPPSALHHLMRIN